jgi:hypothetical protein
MRDAPSVEELHSDRFEQLVMLRHHDLVEFAAQYFLQRTSWLTRLHHGASIAAVIALMYATFRLPPVGGWILQFAAGAVSFIVVLLPLHELLHAAAYRAVGARHLRWNWTRKGFAVYVLAHRDVVHARPFVFVALVPFVVINAALIAGAMAFPSYAVGLVSALLLHIGGTAGDFALLNFLLEHRTRDVYTYDDGDTGETFFFARRSEDSPARAGLPMSVGSASLPLRLLVASMWMVPAAIALAGAFYAASFGWPARALATVVLIPFSLIAAIAAIYVVAPRGEFGDWLDLALPALRDRATAVLVALLLILASSLILGAESCRG